MKFKKNKEVKYEKIDLQPQIIAQNAQTSLKTGLLESEVQTKILALQTNKATVKNSKTVRDILLSNIITVFNFITFGIAIWLATVGSYRNMIFIVVVIVNIGIGILQEMRAKKKMEELSLISAPLVHVFRDGQEQKISSDDVVLGDILLLKLGEQICADSVVVQGKIEVNEALLTGESDSVNKVEGQTLYSGSYVVAGECQAQVVQVGLNNYIQRLAAQAKKYQKPKSEIMSSLRLLMRIITVVVLVVGVALFINQRQISNITYQDAVVSTAGSVIGMIPSGLFLLTTISLAYGVIKLSKWRTLVNDLYCIEMLARVNVLCLDKTGTITDGTMRVKQLIDYNTADFTTPKILALLQGTFKENNPTALALAKKYGKKAPYKALATIPFSSVRKYSAASFLELKMTFLLGAPEFIYQTRYPEIQSTVEQLAKQGYRVLLLAGTAEMIAEEQALDEKQFITLAIIGIEDSIRKDAIETINYFQKSGVEVKVISGDNPLTVAMIAKRAGVTDANKYVSLEGKLDARLEHLALTYNVFGRVTPSQKKILVQIYKKHHKTVAMTGDGVNDILAMKEADCAIAMANGSEATRSVAHLVLLDSNFSAMPKVVREGRRVINNIQRVATLFLTKTVFSFFLSIVVILMKNAYPLQTIQLLMFDFLVITFPSIYLAVEENNSQIKGRFLVNVLTSALPGALLVVGNYLLIIFNVSYLDMSYPAISTALVLVVICIGLFVLYKVCKPFNVGRGIMYSFMWIIFATILAFFADFFYISELSYPEILLVLMLAFASLAIYPWMNRMAKRIKDWLRDKFAPKQGKN